MNQWIKVSERLPEKQCRALTYDKCVRQATFYIAGNNTESLWIGEGDEPLDPTHWMPLPEPPKDDNKLRSIGKNRI